MANEKTKHTGIERLADGKYRIRATGKDPRTGKIRERTHLREGITLRDAIKLREQWADEIRRGDGQQERTRLAAYARSWLGLRLPSLKPSTRRSYAGILDRRVLPALGDYYLDALTPADVSEFLSRQGASAPNVFRVLRALLRDATAELDLPRDPTARVKVPTRRVYGDENPNVLTADELRRVLDAFREHEPRWHALVLTLALTGLRWGEATALRWEDIDEAKGVIRVRRAHSEGVVSTTKTDSVRTVPLVAELAAALREHRRALVAAQHPGVEGGYVFPSASGKLRRYGVMRRPLTRALRAAGVANALTVHGFRRTFNNLCRQVTSGEVVRSITGHVTERMTEHYSHVDASEKRAAASAVLRLVQGAPPLAPTPDSGDALGNSLGNAESSPVAADLKA